MSSTIVVAYVPEGHVFDVAVKPWRVWTAIPPHTNPEAIPETLQHHINAFLESELHDWSWKNGVLRYYSRCVDIGEEAWIFLEYRSE